MADLPGQDRRTLGLGEVRKRFVLHAQVVRVARLAEDRRHAAVVDVAFVDRAGVLAVLQPMGRRFSRWSAGYLMLLQWVWNTRDAKVSQIS